MARLRFPGRPGHRFDRISVKYFADDYRNIADPSLAFLPRFQSGLKEFRELTGGSDEEYEFEGFTEEDVKSSERQLREFLAQQRQEAKSQDDALTSEDEDARLIRATRLSQARQSLDSLPVIERTRNRMKTLVRKSYSEVLKTGLVSPGKTHAVVKVKDICSPSPRGRPKKFKLDMKKDVHETRRLTERTAGGVKKSEKDRAKFLLEKAKQANMLAQQKIMKRKVSPGLKHPKKQFVLPTQSSRSSRVIKPNKRFLEDESFDIDIKKKSKLGDSQDDSFSVQNSSLNSSSSSLREPTPSKSTMFSNKYSPGLNDKSLICDGKRDRKPSLKLRLDSDFDSLDNYSKFAEHFHSGKSPPAKSHGGLTSPLAAPKLGTSLFTSPESQAQFKKASEKQRLGMLGLGSTRKQGASIVQKAKLQLNIAALNKSKAALAKSLKAEMKREATIAKQELIKAQDLTSPTRKEEPVSSPVSEEPTKKKYKRKCCFVCSQKTDLQLCREHLVCRPCMTFYRKVKYKAIAGKVLPFSCKYKGSCKITPENRANKCRFCRMKLLIDAGFPQASSVRFLVESGQQQEAPAVKQEPQVVMLKPSKMASPGVKAALAAKVSPQKVPAKVQVVKMVSEDCNTEPRLLEDESEEELSPLKREEGSEKKHRKRRAFKELLRTKQDKSDKTDKHEKPEPIIRIEILPPSTAAQPTQPPLVSPVQGSVEESPSPGAPGPRIKHVCRNAAVVLGKSLACFPDQGESSGLRLSALPTKDKVQLWKKEEETRAATVESDDDRPMDEIIQKSPESVVIMKKSPAVKPGKLSKKLTSVGGMKIYKRALRCKTCTGCLAKECGTCRHCLDKPKFGGPGTYKQACIKRRCLNRITRRNATPGFINPKDSGTDSNTESLQGSPSKSTRPAVITVFPMSAPQQDSSSVVPGAENSAVTVTGLEYQSGTLVDDETAARSVLRTDGTQTMAPSAQQGSSSLRGTRSEVRQLDFDTVPEVRLERVSRLGRPPGKISSRLMKKIEFQQKFSKPQGNNDPQCYPVLLQNVIPASRQWGSILSQPRYHPIKIDFKTDCDINSAWTYGIALTMSAAMSVRTLCFLCGSAGKHEMLYCNLCCEPYHEFCLEDFERPSREHYDDWVCSKCQYCHVCGRQNHLLQCDRCQNTYHPNCLGPNYPTKPSKKKNIWICTKCVKCKSCGATTPGTSSNATWTYDFSLCYECGQLMDKGNFCPICHKCYSDDDWESKMIQCNMCDSWVHSRCEGLTDEMYEILSYLPEDLSFYCRNCHPQGCPEWERTLKRELQQGLENILHTLILTKSAQYILRQEQKRSPLKGSSPDSSKQLALEGLPNQLAIEAPPDTAAHSVADEPTDKNYHDSQSDNSEIDKDTHAVCTETTSETTDSSKKTSGSGDECVKQDTKQSCDTEEVKHDESVTIDTSVSESKGCEGEKVCDNSTKDCDSTVSAEKAACEQQGVPETTQTAPDVGSNTTENIYVSVPVARAGMVSDLLKREIEVIIPPADNEAKLLTRSSHKSETQEAVSTPSTQRQEGNVSMALVKSNPQKSVCFKLDEDYRKTRERTPECDAPEEKYPKDLMAMAEQMKEGRYNSVAVFCEDLLRIIQEYLDDDTETRTSRKKAVISARSCFVKQMEKIFPWFKVKTCQYWFSNKNMPHGMLPDATLPPTMDHTYAQWLERTITPMSPQPSPFKKRIATPVKKIMPFDEEEGEAQTFMEGEDMRRCLFCLQYGDQDPNEAGRLLYCGQDDWCHINCALWSAEVYEDADGALQNLVKTYSRGKQLRCNVCNLLGATVGCNTPGCKANYHFMCARRAKCRLQEDKKVFCDEHASHVDAEILTRNRFKVLRRVFVENVHVRNTKKAWAKGLSAENIRIVFGNCYVENLGRLTDLSDKPKFLQPVDFMSSRIYWSTKDARRRCVYTCRIIEVRPEQLKSPTVSIRDMRIVHDENHPDFVPLSSLNLSGIDLGCQIPAICEKNVEDTVDLTEVTNDSSGTLSASEDCQIISLVENKVDRCQASRSAARESQDKQVLPERTLETGSGRRASFSGILSYASQPTKPLSSSWPRPKEKTTAKSGPVDLSFLSPQTLKLLNIKDPSKYSKPSQIESRATQNDDDDCTLLKVAERLNRAAAKSSKTEPGQKCNRSSSVESGSPRCLSRSASPVARQARAQSVDRVEGLKSSSIAKPWSPIGVVPSNKLANLPESPFSPPMRMSARARSLSVDKELCLSNSIAAQRKVTCEGFGGNFPRTSGFMDSKPVVSLLKNSAPISISLMSPEPVPVDCSSPTLVSYGQQGTRELATAGEPVVSVADRQSTDDGVTTSSAVPDTDCTESQIASVEESDTGVEGTETDSQSSSISLCLTDETGETQETIVVMTESGESLSEEEAIKIVQEVYSSSSENITQSSETLEDTNCGAEEGTCDDVNKSSSAVESNVSWKDVDNANLGMETDNATMNSINQDTELESAIDSDFELINLETDSPFVPNFDGDMENDRNTDMKRNVRLNRAVKTKTKEDKVDGKGETESEVLREDGDQLSSTLQDQLKSGSPQKSEQEVDSPDDDLEIDESGDVNLTEDDKNEQDMEEGSSISRTDSMSVEAGKERNEVDSVIEDDSDLELLYEIDAPLESDSSLDEECSRQTEDGKESTGIDTDTVETENIGDDLNERPTSDIDDSIVDEGKTVYDLEVVDSEKQIVDGIKTTDELQTVHYLKAVDETCLQTTDKLQTDNESGTHGKQTVNDGQTTVELQNVDELKTVEETDFDTAEGLQSVDEVNTVEELQTVDANHANSDEQECYIIEEKTNSEMNESQVIVQTADRVDSDEIDGDDTRQVLDPAEMKAELTQFFSETGLNGDSVEKEILLKCISVIEEGDGTTRSLKLLSLDVGRKSPEIFEKKLSQTLRKLERSLSRESEKSDQENVDVVPSVVDADISVQDKSLTILADEGQTIDTGTDVDEVKETAEDERSPEDERDKHEVLRGLGLGTCDEVQKIKNSPPKLPSPIKIYEPTLAQRLERKRRYLQKSPLKIYPLRKCVVYPVRRDDTENFIERAGNSEKLRILTGGTENKAGAISKLPVLDPISKKIKEESIAKSCPEEKGPFKCPMCRRMYRTDTSYTAHIENCTFCVSSSDDENSEGDANSLISKTRKQVKLMRYKRRLLKQKKMGTLVSAKNYKDDAKEDDKATEVKSSSLRNSTMNQRVALEAEEKRQQQQGVKAKRRGRPPLKMNLEKDCKSNVDKAGETLRDTSLERRGRGRPRKYPLTSPDTTPDCLSNREQRRKSREINMKEMESDSSDSENSAGDTTEIPVPVKRGRGRPRKINIKEVENGCDDSENGAGDTTENPALVKRGRGRPRKISMKEMEDDSSDSERGAGDATENPVPVKRGRGRPRKISMKEMEDDSSDSESGAGDATEHPVPVKRGRGRPRKIVSNGVDSNEAVDPNKVKNSESADSIELGKRKLDGVSYDSPADTDKKKRLCKTRSVDIEIIDVDSIHRACEKELKPPDIEMKKSIAKVIMSACDQKAEIVTAKQNTGKTIEGKMATTTSTVGKKSSDERMVNGVIEISDSDDDDSMGCDMWDNQSSGESNDELLDPLTGLLVDKKTGKLISHSDPEVVKHALQKSEAQERKSNEEFQSSEGIGNTKDSLPDCSVVKDMENPEHGEKDTLESKSTADNQSELRNDKNLSESQNSDTLREKESYASPNSGNDQSLNSNSSKSGNNVHNSKTVSNPVDSRTDGSSKISGPKPCSNLQNTEPSPNCSPLIVEPSLISKPHSIRPSPSSSSNNAEQSPGPRHLDIGPSPSSKLHNVGPSTSAKSSNNGQNPFSSPNIIGQRPPHKESDSHTKVGETTMARDGGVDIQKASTVGATQVKSPLGAGLPSQDIPKAVLQLLKEGHKVVIRNPKMNKSFMWQKTESGYLGKALDSNEFNTLNSAKPVPTSQNVTVDKIPLPVNDTEEKLNETSNDKFSNNNMSGKHYQSASEILAARKKAMPESKATTEPQQRVDTKIPEVVRLLAPQQPGHARPTIAKMLSARAGKSAGNQPIAPAGSQAQTQPAVRSIAPAGFAPLRAEYMGGVVIAKTKDRTVAQVRERIENTAYKANNALRSIVLSDNSALLQGQAYSSGNILPVSSQPGIQTAGPSSIFTSGTAPGNIPAHISPEAQGFVTDFAQPVQIINKQPMMLQQPSAQSSPFPQFAQTGLHTLTGAQAVLGMNVNLQAQGTVFQAQPLEASPPAAIYTAQPLMTSPPAAIYTAQPLVSSPQMSAMFQQQSLDPLCSPIFQQPTISSGLSPVHILCSQASMLQSAPASSSPCLPTMVQKFAVTSPQVQLTQLKPRHITISSQAQVTGLKPHHVPIAPQQTQHRPQMVPVASSQAQPQLALGSSQAQLLQRQLGSLLQAQPGAAQSSSGPAIQTLPSTIKSQLHHLLQAPATSQPQASSQPPVSSQASHRLLDHSFARSPHLLSTLLTQPDATTSKPSPSNIPTGVQKSSQKQAILTIPSSSFSSSQPGQTSNTLPSPRSAKYEKMKKFLMHRALQPIAAKPNKPVVGPIKKPRKTSLMKKVLKMELEANGVVKGGYSNVNKKPGFQVNKEKKKKHIKASDFAALRRKAVAQPHSIDKASHPIIHAQKEQTCLPTAAVELEVTDVPLSDLADPDNNNGAGPEGQKMGHLEYEITSDDGFKCRADTLDGAWKQITEKVQDARAASRLKQLEYAGLPVLQMFGISHPSVMYHVEQLYGANYCRKYKFKYHKHELAEQELELVNPSGCIRTEPFAGRNPPDMFSFLLSRYRQLPPREDPAAWANSNDAEMTLKSSRRATSMDLPMAMRFRKLKEHAKEAVGVYRSYIHGRGLFCKRKIDAGEMIIEYSGELIRNSMTDQREKYYESKGIGCYMFRIDDVDVVDATMKGSAARFINHSCEPNCYSKVITVDNRKHIVIFAMRPIARGEELTYDYKFPIEEVKIPCTCGSKKCRKYLN